MGVQMIEYKMGGACSTHGTDEKCIQNLNGKTASKKSFRRRLEDNIKMKLEEIRFECVQWVRVAQNRVQ